MNSAWPADTKPDVPWSAGSADIDVDGDDVTNVVIPVAPAFSISGTLVFDGTAAPGAFGSMTLPIRTTGSFATPSPYFKRVDASHFTISGLMSGTYRTTGVVIPGIRTPIAAWWLKSIVINGRDVLDGTIEVRQPGDGAVVTFSDQASSVSGRALDGEGVPLPNAFVVIFGADRASWFANSRRIASVRTDAQGRYAVRNLPPGEYRAVAVLDLDQNAWFDPDVLQTLVPATVRFTIAGVETKTLDLVVR
jgi:hypothetical protein